MMSNTFGAPLGGTTDGGQYGLESLAVSLITPSNFGGSGGSCLPPIVVVALGEPGVPVICWAKAPGASDRHRRTIVDDRKLAILITTSSNNGRFRGAPHALKWKDTVKHLHFGAMHFRQTSEISARGTHVRDGSFSTRRSPPIRTRSPQWPES